MRIPFSLKPAAAATTDLVALGECSLDTLTVVDRYPAPDEKSRLLARADAPGGQAATAALTCRRLGWRARYVGCVGDDAEAYAALDPLVRYGVQVRVQICRGARTRTAIVVIDAGAGTRTVLESRDPNLRFPSPLDPESICTGRVLLVDATDVAASTAAAGLARAAGIPVLLDADTPAPALAGLLAVVDVIVMPARALCELSAATDVGAALVWTAARYPSTIVIATLGADGALARVAGAEVRAEAHRVTVVDTTGAGDVFRGGLVAGWLRAGADARLEDILRYANVVAAESCTALGAQGGLPSRADVDRLI